MFLMMNQVTDPERDPAEAEPKTYLALCPHDFNSHIFLDPLY